MTGKAQQLIGGIASALLAAAILAGVAQAQRPDDRAGMIGVGGAANVVAPDAFERAVNNALTAAGPDAFERAVNNASSATPVRPDDRSGLRGPGAVPSAQSPITSVASRNEFQWGDAAVGAGAAIGFVLLGGAFMLTVRQRGRVIIP